MQAVKTGLRADEMSQYLADRPLSAFRIYKRLPLLRRQVLKKQLCLLPIFKQPICQELGRIRQSDSS